MRLIDVDALKESIEKDTCPVNISYFYRKMQEAKTVDVSEISDGYHTFADLYEQRLVLSAALAKNNPNAWKSKLHSDGTEPFGGGWFVMGWKTNEGQYTYHYELKDWDLFDCKEIQTAPEWDGHTSADVRRLLSMSTVNAAQSTREKVQWHTYNIYCCDSDGEPIFKSGEDYSCSKCNYIATVKTNFCPNCGADMRAGR